mmetsp:Transcript_8052/g.17479  ORF Transcript_8052/g.17479 Transcript_8052/m.17479 type:complete len:223 (-) Transcript_8052:683-1351(-)
MRFAHVVGDRLHVTLDALGRRSSGGELEANDRLLNESLAEDLALFRPKECIAESSTDLPKQVVANQPSFVVKVVHDKPETVILLPEQVFSWHLHVIEDHQSSPSTGGVCGLNLASVHTVSALDEDKRETCCTWPTRPHRRHEVVGVGALSDPLLDTIDNVELPIGSLLGSSTKGGHVAASERLADGQGTPFHSAQERLTNVLLHLCASEVEDSRRGNQPTRT